MTLRIETVSDGRLVILHLSGRLQAEHLDELKAHMESAGRREIVLNLDEVKLVDRDAVCFLAACEAKGVFLTQCSLYIRDWINREKTS